MNLDCPELIADYHKRINSQSKKSSNDTPVQSTPPGSQTNKRPAQEPLDQSSTQPDLNDAAKKTKRANDFGYGRGLEIEKILGATDVYGELMFL